MSKDAFTSFMSSLSLAYSSNKLDSEMRRMQPGTDFFSPHSREVDFSQVGLVASEEDFVTWVKQKQLEQRLHCQAALWRFC